MHLLNVGCNQSIHCLLTAMELLLISPVASGRISNNPSIIGHAVMLVFPLVKTHVFMQVASVDQLFMRLLYKLKPLSHIVLYMSGERHQAKVLKERQKLYV